MQKMRNDRAVNNLLHVVVSVALVAAAGLFPGACSCDGDSSDTCRFNPDECDDGRAGAFCDSDDDCRDICCTDAANCAGGMCTFSCLDDFDCPSDMACQHDMCFYSCEFDDDCAVGQTCEHGNTVCEWP